MLTRKYYRIIAKAIKENTTKDESGNNYNILDKDNLICDLAMSFENDNNLFNYDKFIEACK